MEEIVKINNLGKTFGKTSVLEHIDFSMKKGEVYGLVGQNGAGKTTLLRLIAGLMKPTCGRIEREGAGCIGYMPQSCRFDDRSSVAETIRFFAGLRGADAEKSFELSRKLELTGAKKVKHLSPGQQKKLQMIVAMAGDPALYILDEPTAGLDPSATEEILHQIRSIHAEGKSILLSSHILQNMDDVCTNVAIMEKGHMVYDRAIEESFVVKTNPLPILLAETLQSRYELTFNRDRSVLTMKADAGDISEFVAYLVSMSVNILEVSGSNVKNIVQEHMDRKGAVLQ